MPLAIVETLCIFDDTLLTRHVLSMQVMFLRCDLRWHPLTSLDSISIVEPCPEPIGSSSG